MAQFATVSQWESEYINIENNQKLTHKSNERLYAQMD